MEIKTKEEYESAINQTGAMVIDFTATWCGPCKLIAPKLDELALANPHIRFYKVDVETMPELAEAFQIVGVPTFYFLVNGLIVGNFSGADLAKLQEYVAKLNECVKL